MRVDGILSELHPRFPSGVARPIVCTSWHNGTYVQIQEGLGGMPWFRLSDGLSSSNDWKAMLERAVKAMLRPARRDPRGAGMERLECSPGAELRRQAALLQPRRDGCSASRVLARIRHLEPERFETRWDRCESCWQHGDFR